MPPMYDFRVKETGEILEKRLSISDYDNFVKDNPQLERYLGNQTLHWQEGGLKVDGGMTEVLNRIKSNHHESTIQV